MSYHINEKGEPGRCSAQKGRCPFGGAHQHYETAEKAQAAFELSMAAETIPTLSREERIARLPRANSTIDPITGEALVPGFPTYQEWGTQNGFKPGSVYADEYRAAREEFIARPPSSVTGLPYPVEKDRVRLGAHVGASDSTLGKHAYKEGEVVEFTGTYYSVKMDTGETVQVHYDDLFFAPGHDRGETVRPAPSTPKAEPKPYPVEGDTVLIKPNAAVHDADLAPFVGKKADVIDFNGSSYEVKFPNGQTHRVHYSTVAKTEPDLALNDVTPYGRIIGMSGDEIMVRDETGLGTVGQPSQSRTVPRSAVLEAIALAKKKAAQS